LQKRLPLLRRNANFKARIVCHARHDTGRQKPGNSLSMGCKRADECIS
jgi:hypothetical protein